LNLVFQAYLSFADGNWSDWSPWTDCTCSGEDVTRTRSCNSPAPADGGQDCTPEIGSTTEWIENILVETELRGCDCKLIFIRRKKPLFSYSSCITKLNCLSILEFNF
jgi:hypothetical protein